MEETTILKLANASDGSYRRENAVVKIVTSTDGRLITLETSNGRAVRRTMAPKLLGEGTTFE